MPFPAIPIALALGSALAGGLASKTQKKGKVLQSPTQSRNQIARSEAAGNMALEQLQNPYQGFAPIAQQAQENFYGNVVPSLAQRFTNMSRSGGGALSSPAFQSALGAAGAQHSTGLAALQAQYGQNQQQLAQNLLRFGQAPQFENNYIAGGPSFASGVLGGLSGAMGNAAGSGFQSYFNNYFNNLNQQQQPPVTPLSNPQIMDRYPNSPIAQDYYTATTQTSPWNISPNMSQQQQPAVNALQARPIKPYNAVGSFLNQQYGNTINPYLQSLRR